MDGFWVLVILGIAVAMVWWAIQQGQAGNLTFEASQNPMSVIQAAIHSFSTKGWTTTSQGPNAVTFSLTQTPGCLITLFLLCFGIIPGLLYWIAAKRTLSLSITARSVSGQPERSAVQIGWNRNGGGRGPSLQFKQLIAPNAIALSSAISGPSTITGQLEDFTDGAFSAGRIHADPLTQQPTQRASQLPEATSSDVTRSPECIRCGKLDLTPREASRIPILCDDCLAALQRG